MTWAPSLCASRIAAPRISRLTAPWNLNQVAPSETQYADDPPRLLGARQDPRVAVPLGPAVEVWAGDVEARTRQDARIHRPLEVEFLVGELAPRGHRRGDAVCEVEQGTARAHLGHPPHAAEVRVLVQLHQPRDQRMSGEVHHGGARPARGVAGRGTRPLRSRGPAEHHRLVVAARLPRCRRPRARGSAPRPGH